MKLVPMLLLVFVLFANDSDSLAAVQKTVQKSEKDAIAAIKNLGGKIKLDKSGKVEFVGFEGKMFTDADLVHLKKLSKLNVLILLDTKVTKAGVVELQTALPSSLTSLRNSKTLECWLISE